MRQATTIANFSGTIKGGGLLLVGKCAECHSHVARVIEGSSLDQVSNSDCLSLTRRYSCG